MRISVLSLIDPQNEFTAAVGAYTDPELLAEAVAVLNASTEVRVCSYKVNINELTVDMPLDLADYAPVEDEDE